MVEGRGAHKMFQPYKMRRAGPVMPVGNQYDWHFVLDASSHSNARMMP